MWTVRPESPAAPDVDALVRAYFAELTVRYFHRETDDAEIDLTLEEFPADGLGVFLVLRADGVAAGHLGVYPTGELTRFYVSPEYRRGGGGRALLAAAEAWARAQNLPRLFLDTRTDLVEARAFYASCGFTELPHRPTARTRSKTTGSRSPSTHDRVKSRGRAADQSYVQARYVIFDLDDTLVHSDAVRTAFATVGAAYGIARPQLNTTLDGLPGRPAREIFAALGLGECEAIDATDRFLAVLDGLNRVAPPVAYPDADDTLRQLAAQGAKLMLSTGSSPERAKRVLDQEGWDAFTVVLGSDHTCSKGEAHYDRFALATPELEWTDRAVTVGDSAQDMRLGARHGVPVRIGIDRDGDPRPLYDAGATHVVSALAEVLAIVASVRVVA